MTTICPKNKEREKEEKKHGFMYYQKFKIRSLYLAFPWQKWNLWSSNYLCWSYCL